MGSIQEQVTLQSLAAEINSQASTYAELLQKAKLPAPSFGADAPGSPPSGKDYEQLQHARMSLIHSAQAIKELALGPAETIREYTDGIKHDLGVLQVINHFKIPQMIPLDGDVAYADIAKKLGLSEYRMHRILRHAMTFRVFRETRPGYVGHTGPSAAFVREPLLCDWVGFNLEEGFPADTKLAAALEQYGESEEPGDSAIGLAFDFPAEKTYWDFIANDGAGSKQGWRQKRFAQGMSYLANEPARAHHHLHKSFDWAGLGKATVVDVGGSTGHVSIELAKVYPDLEFVVQDFAPLSSYHDDISDDLKPRIAFQAQDILKPNEHKNAEVYLLRSILHDWSDKYAILILKQLVPALKDGARVLIADVVMPDTHVSGTPWFERSSTIKSMQMMTFVNAKERTEQDWKDVVHQSDPGYTVTNFVTPPGASQSVIEIVYKSGK